MMTMTTMAKISHSQLKKYGRIQNQRRKQNLGLISMSINYAVKNFKIEFIKMFVCNFYNPVYKQAVVHE